MGDCRASGFINDTEESGKKKRDEHDRTFFFFVLFVFRVEKKKIFFSYLVQGLRVHIQNSVGDFFEALDYQIASTQFFSRKIPQGRARFSSPTR